MQVKRLEIELRVAKGSANTDTGGGDSGRSPDSSILVTLMESQLEDVRTEKKDREDSLIAAKKQNVELIDELQRTAKSLTELQQSSVSNSAEAANAKSLEQQLAQKSNTIRLLEDRLKEKETSINRLEQEKSKLENYAKQTLSNFKDKYMEALQKMKTDKKYLEDKNALLQVFVFVVSGSLDLKQL
jgi:uncharacterized protein (DUF3084 family)